MKYEQNYIERCIGEKQQKFIKVLKCASLDSEHPSSRKYSHFNMILIVTNLSKFDSTDYNQNYNVYYIYELLVYEQENTVFITI